MNHSITLTALGTTWWIEIFDDISTERRDGMEDSITTLLSSIETRFSRFRDDSIVGRLNRDRVVVTSDADLTTMIGIGRDMYRKTKGAFNILVGDALVARGYDQDYTLIAQDRAITIGNPLTDIDYHDGRWYLTTGLLDLGGIGKGWAIDQVALLLRNEGVQEFLINGGGDMYGTTEQGEPITIYLEHPTEPHTYLGTTHLMHQGFAASSMHKRRWKTAAGVTSHIVRVTEQFDASFVLAQSATTADTLATAALLLPQDEFAVLAATEHIAYATLTLQPEQFSITADFPFKTL